MSTKTSPVLYITYDGALEPLGQSQVLGYLKRLASTRCVHLISYEKTRDWSDHRSREALRREISDAGIQWHPLRYHKRPSMLATLYDVAVGVALGLGLILRHRIKIVHARGDVPSLIALTLKKVCRTKYLYDMRGFWPDERVDGGIWRADSLIYSVAKRFQKMFLLRADYKVVLTNAGAAELAKMPFLQNRVEPLSVIPTCADLERFYPLPSHCYPFTLGYVGSTGTWYLFDEVLMCFQALRKIQPEARLLVINHGEHDLIREKAEAAGIPPSAMEIKEVRHELVPLEMARMSAGIFVIKPSFSKRASSPTRLAEFLACGLPCLGNAGVGDVAEILEGEQVGVVMSEFTVDGRGESVSRLVDLASEPGIRERCRSVATRRFSVVEGAKIYSRIYDYLDK